MNKRIFSIYGVLLCLFFMSFRASAKVKKTSVPLDVGYSVAINNVTSESMVYAKSVGIDCIETSFGALMNKNERTFALSDEEIIEQVKQAKKAADDAGIEIWSIHMPFGKNIDLSLADETERRDVVELHKKILRYCQLLRPKIILFHPSYYLGLNERELRKRQFIKSANELNKTIRDMGATMVIENMTGPELLAPGGKQERPLCRTVEETMEIMSRLPDHIYSAVDMNHIKQPERLIRALGKRLKTIHVADGDGENERHYFPCSGEGENNWTEILSALHEVKYTGPFMFESAYNDVKDLKACYESLRNEFIGSDSQAFNLMNKKY